MKVSIIANISVNGKVLLAEDPNHQVPQEAIGIFMQVANRAGNLVMGKNTFNMFQPLLKEGPFSGIEIILLSGSEETVNGYKVVSSPEESITYLTEKGFQEIVVGGGTKTYNAFLDRDLVTDFYFNIHPLITSNGGILGTNNDLVSKFKLTEQKHVSDNFIQLEGIRFKV